jgi:beta-glucosidase
LNRTARYGLRGLAVSAALCLAASGVFAASAGASPSRARDTAASAGGTAAACPWLNQKLPVSQRVSELLSAMTLGQKLDLLGLANENGYENVTTAIPQLCVPQLTLNDGPAGIIAGPADSHTQLPSPIGVAATWDTATAAGYGTVLGSEAAAKGIDVVQGPVLNIDRVPLDGRTFELLGEDPYLTSQLGVNIELGIESQGVGTMPKHFAVYNQEKYRNTPADDVIVSDRALHEIYLPAWQQSMTEAHPAAVMCSYASLAGTYDCQNSDLLTTILRDQLGFSGFIRSDLDAVHDPVAGFNAGTDQLKTAEPQALEQGVYDGQISSARLNQAVSLILTQMFQLGVFNHQPAGNADTDASTPAHIAFARQTAEESTVLLKNAGRVLPLRAGQVHSIAVIGADGGTGALTASPPPSSSYVSSSAIVTPYQGIQQAAPAGTSVSYNDGSDLAQAAAAARAASVAVVFADVPEVEGTDLTNLSLPGNQDQLIEAVAAANPNTIVVLNNASPVLMPWLGQVKSVLEAWYPGQQYGNAIAAILFGKADPSGHLPITFPVSLSETPVSSPSQYPGVNGQVDYSEGLDVGYRGYDAEDITPLFPFGYGLSYTTFRFSDLTVSPGTMTSQGSVQVAATVTNTGHRAGTDVAQLYVGDPASVGEPPRQLKGFSRVSLRPGRSARVHFTLTGQELAWYDSTPGAWVTSPGSYQVYVGDSSALAGLPLRGSFQVTGSTGTRHVTITAPGQVQAGSPVTVTATLTSGGGSLAVHRARLALAVPAGWQVRPESPVTAGTLAPSQALTASWQVTAPVTAQDNISQLTATASYHVTGPGGGAGTSSAGTQVTIDPLVTTTVTPQAVTSSGDTTQVTLTNTDTSGYPVSLDWATAPPSGSGITATPATGSVTLAPGATATTALTVTGSASGTTTVPINVTVVTPNKATVPGPGAYLQITSSSLSAEETAPGG